VKKLKQMGFLEIEGECPKVLSINRNRLEEIKSTIERQRGIYGTII